jgi:DnaJ-class molecular chaperone
MANQQRIVLAGAGDEEPGIPPGDVVFVLKQTPHDSFQRSGNDLLTAVHITLSEALFGFSRILVTHLDGRGIHMSSPPGKIIKPGESIVAKGEGMPTYKHPDTKGDLYIVFKIDMPGEEWLNTVDRAVRPIISTLFPLTTPFSNWRNFYHQSGLMSSRDPLLSTRHNSSSATSRTLAGGRSPHLPTSLIMVMKTSGKTKRTMTTNPNAELSDPLLPFSCRWNHFPWYERFLVFTPCSVSSTSPSTYPSIHRFNVPHSI